ncbi:hypothetical protein VARIO8X_50225 [Burkholderiales bacterium 8X]|nr:hypothetical protein VARIO8X_50225 [Burkholderiales bacterium 8X]
MATARRLPPAPRIEASTLASRCRRHSSCSLESIQKVQVRRILAMGSTEGGSRVFGSKPDAAASVRISPAGKRAMFPAERPRGEEIGHGRRGFGLRIVGSVMQFAIGGLNKLQASVLPVPGPEAKHGATREAPDQVVHAA